MFLDYERDPLKWYQEWERLGRLVHQYKSRNWWNAGAFKRISCAKTNPVERPASMVWNSMLLPGNELAAPHYSRRWPRWANVRRQVLPGRHAPDRYSAVPHYSKCACSLASVKEVPWLKAFSNYQIAFAMLQFTRMGSSNQSQNPIPSVRAVRRAIVSRNCLHMKKVIKSNKY